MKEMGDGDEGEVQAKEELVLRGPMRPERNAARGGAVHLYPWQTYVGFRIHSVCREWKFSTSRRGLFQLVLCSQYVAAVYITSRHQAGALSLITAFTFIPQRMNP